MAVPYDGINPISPPNAWSGFGTWTPGTETSDGDPRAASYQNLIGESAQNKCNWLAWRTPNWITGSIQYVGGTVTFLGIQATTPSVLFEVPVAINGEGVDGCLNVYNGNVYVGMDATSVLYPTTNFIIQSGNFGISASGKMSQSGIRTRLGSNGIDVPRVTPVGPVSQSINPATSDLFWLPQAIVGAAITLTVTAPKDVNGNTLTAYSCEFIAVNPSGIPYQINIVDGVASITVAVVPTTSGTMIVFCRWYLNTFAWTVCTQV